MKKNQQLLTIATAILVLSSITIGVSAPPPPAIPFDGGISLLLGGALIVAIKKIFFK
jgi:hypothetical protein